MQISFRIGAWFVATIERQDQDGMADQASNAKKSNGNGGNLGFEADLFKTADKLRGNMEPSDYKHVALGLIFLKHISDSLATSNKQAIDGLSSR
jgi:type I restriction-modification system DNA methylase subunit